MYDPLFHGGFGVLAFLGFSFYRGVDHLAGEERSMKIGHHNCLYLYHCFKLESYVQNR